MRTASHERLADGQAGDGNRVCSSPIRCIAIAEHPAMILVEGSQVQGADLVATGSWRNEPSEDRQSAFGYPRLLRAFVFLTARSL